ncbi:MAG TPA: hypothetical protein VKL22_09565, partial [Actinomycetota bacterium]|nr:hypothetical protein [Actinomycetota bacterium]
MTSPTAADPPTARAIAPAAQGEPGSPPGPDGGGGLGVCPSIRGSTLAERVGVGDGDGLGVGPGGTGEVLGAGVGDVLLVGAGVGAGPGQAPPRRGIRSRLTWVVSEVELLARLGSDWLPVTLAELVTHVGSRGAVTSTVTVDEAPGARDPRLQTMAPFEPVQLPCEAWIEASCTWVGRFSVRVTPVAMLGPALAT